MIDPRTCPRCRWHKPAEAEVCASCRALIDDIRNHGFRPGMPLDPWTQAAQDEHLARPRSGLRISLVRDDEGKVCRMEWRSDGVR